MVFGVYVEAFVALKACVTSLSCLSAIQSRWTAVGFLFRLRWKSVCWSEREVPWKGKATLERLLFCVPNSSDSVTLEYYGPEPEWEGEEEERMQTAMTSFLSEISQSTGQPLHAMLRVPEEALQLGNIKMMHLGKADSGFLFDSWLS
jgi:hypothetical protein